MDKQNNKQVKCVLISESKKILNAGVMVEYEYETIITYKSKKKIFIPKNVDSDINMLYKNINKDY